MALITSGRIRIEFGNLARTETIDANGEANFKGVAHRFFGDEVTVLPQVEGYKQRPQRVVLSGTVVTMLLDEDRAETLFRGQVEPPPRFGQIVRVLVEGEQSDATPDQFGRFQLSIHHRVGDQIRIQVYSEGRQVYDEYQIVPDQSESLTIHPVPSRQRISH